MGKQLLIDSLAFFSHSIGAIKTRQKRVGGSRQHMWTKPEEISKNDSTVLKESASMSTPKDESEQSIIKF